MSICWHSSPSPSPRCCWAHHWFLGWGHTCKPFPAVTVARLTSTPGAKANSCKTLPAQPLQPGCSRTWLRKQMHELGSGKIFSLTTTERECCRKREISFPFSDYSNEWPTIPAQSHFCEMLKLAQKPQQQWRNASPATVARRPMAAHFHFSACAVLCPSCQAAPGNQSHWQPALKPLLLGFAALK